MKLRGDSFVSPPFTRCFCICIMRKGGVKKGGSDVSPRSQSSRTLPAPVHGFVQFSFAGPGLQLKPRILRRAGFRGSQRSAEA